MLPVNDMRFVAKIRREKVNISCKKTHVGRMDIMQGAQYESPPQPHQLIPQP